MRRGRKINTNPIAFLRDLRKHLSVNAYILVCGTPVTGEALSHLIKQLRWDDWQLPGKRGDCANFFEELGCSINSGTNSRGNHAEVVYLEFDNAAEISTTELRKDA